MHAYQLHFLKQLCRKSSPVQTETSQKDLRPRIRRGDSKSAVYILFGRYLEDYLKRSEIGLTKIYTADLDSPRRELSNGCLGIAVHSLYVFSGLIFRVFFLLRSNPAVVIVLLLILHNYYSNLLLSKYQHSTQALSNPVVHIRIGVQAGSRYNLKTVGDGNFLATDFVW